MPYIIGTDEAGYGPNLGPLCVAATVWHVDEDVDPTTLYKHLRRVVVSSTDRATKKRVVWADSKAVYKNGCGMDHLERGVLAAMGLTGRSANHWSDLWSEGPTAEIPWHDGYSATLPLWMQEPGGPEWMTAEATADLCDGLRENLAAAGVRLIGLLSRAVFPGTFNEMVQASNKADALSRITLALVAEAIALVPPEPIQVYCDRHGGRDYYLPLLQTQFPDDWIQVRHESDAQSTYRFGPDERRIDIGFYVGGERFLPVALASMTAKYLRETAMRPFNEFWCGRVPGLKPTAGYPTDSWRFKKEIAAAQRELEIDDRILWRSR